MTYIFMFLIFILFVRGIVCLVCSLSPKHSLDDAFSLICQSIACWLVMFIVSWIAMVAGNF